MDELANGDDRLYELVPARRKALDEPHDDEKMPLLKKQIGTNVDSDAEPDPEEGAFEDYQNAANLEEQRFQKSKVAGSLSKS